MNKHILINSYIRSGGSLMARLLDGHSLLRVLPVEMSYSKRKVVFPNFNKKLYSTEEFLEEIDLKRSFQKLDEKGVISKDPYGKQIIDFSYDEFIGELNKSIGNKAFTFSEGIDLVFINFFNNWKNYYARDLLQKKANEHVYVNHLSAACFADFSEYFDTFTNSIIIQTVRNPFAWYASVKTHIGISDNHQVFLEYALLLWLESTIRGLIARNQKNEQYIFLRYEDLICNFETTLGKICKVVNIEFEQVLLHPTMNEQNWRGNSSYGDQVGINKRGLSQWKKILTNTETNQINQITQELNEILGYSDSNNLSQVVWNVDEFYASYIGFPILLKVLDDYERQKLESMRMSVLMQLIFHGSLMRNLGERYQRKNIFSKLKNKFFSL